MINSIIYEVISIPTTTMPTFKKRDKVGFNLLSEESEALNYHYEETIQGSHAWFWSKEWQEKESEADEDIKRGRVTTIKNKSQLRNFFKSL